MSVDDVIQTVRQLGKGTLLTKFDLENAYWLVPVYPTDHLLLGMRWEGSIHVNRALLFGLRSAPKLFTAVADAIRWIMGNHGVCEKMHYLDGFLVLGPAGSEECRRALEISLQICWDMGVTVASQKTEGPSMVLLFLCILLDTERIELRLPFEKLIHLRSLIRQWKGRKSCRKRQLLSLIRQLQYACRDMQAGCSFLRHLINLSTVP